MKPRINIITLAVNDLKKSVSIIKMGFKLGFK